MAERRCECERGHVDLASPPAIDASEEATLWHKSSLKIAVLCSGSCWRNIEKSLTWPGISTEGSPHFLGCKMNSEPPSLTLSVTCFCCSKTISALRYSKANNTSHFSRVCLPQAGLGVFCGKSLSWETLGADDAVHDVRYICQVVMWEHADQLHPH